MYVSTVGLEAYRKRDVCAVRIHDLDARVHQFERERLEIGTATDDMVLLMLGHFQNHPAETVTLGVHFLTSCVLLSARA